MPYNQGDIVLVKFPYTDLSDFKIRPAIVVSNAYVNSSNDCVVVMLTTRNVRGHFVTTISNSDVTNNFRPPHSTQNVYCKKIAVLENSIIIRKISEVSNREKLNEIIDLIKTAFDIL